MYQLIHNLDNAFILVPNVFLRHGKTEFELKFLFSVLLLKIKTRNAKFNFRFLSFVLVRHWKTKFGFRYSFFVYAFLTGRI